MRVLVREAAKAAEIHNSDGRVCQREKPSINLAFKEEGQKKLQLQGSHKKSCLNFVTSLHEEKQTCQRKCSSQIRMKM